MRRHLLGLITLAIFGAAFVFWRTEAEYAAAAVCLRVGLVLGAIWLALPQIRDMAAKVPPWMILVSLAALFLVAFRPAAIVIFIPIAIAVGVTQFIKFLFKPLPPRRKRNATKPVSAKSVSTKSGLSKPTSEDPISTKPTKRS